jgi:Ca2+-binding EF-hand superfamily protein
MRTVLPVLFSLLAAWPVLAQEKALPAADPELAALEQEIFDLAMLNNFRADLNYNGKCEPAEQALVLSGWKYFDLDHDDQVDLLELAIGQLGIPCPLSFYVDRQEFFGLYRKQHPGPINARELRQAIDEELALNAIAALACRDRSVGWWESLRARLAKEEDRNHNGILDHDELVMRGALDRALLLFFGDTFCDDFDLDNDGVLSQAERDAVLDTLKPDLDLDNDGQVSLNDLQVLTSHFSRTGGGSYFNFDAFSLKRSLGDDVKHLLPIYDRNGDGIWQPLEIVFANLTEDELAAFFHRLNPPINPEAENQTPFTPEARTAFIKQFLANRDLNGNGKIDFAEIPRSSWDPNVPDYGPDPLDQLIGYRLDDAKPPIPPEVLVSLRQPAAAMQRLSRNPRIPTTSRDSIMSSLLALYDSNHDGKLDAEEAWAGNATEYILRCVIYPGKKPFPLTLAQQQAWLARMLTLYDKNQDGRLSMVEASNCAISEAMWVSLRDINATTKRLNQNGDRWLDPEERKALIPEILKHYDFNKNGLLELGELIAYRNEEACKHQLFGHLLTAEEEADWNKHGNWFDFDQDGKTDIWSVPPSSMLFDPGKDPLSDYQVLLRWHEFMLKNYDTNQNGRIDQAEVSDYYAWASQWAILASNRHLPPLPASLPELQQWALANGDANHDGKLSLRELTRLNQYLEKQKRVQTDLFELQKIDLQHPTMAELTSAAAFTNLVYLLEPLYPEFDKNQDMTLDPLEKLELAKYLINIGDRNGNGRLEYVESYRFWRLNCDKAEAAREKRRPEQLRRWEAQAQQEQDAEWLKKYDFNANGKLDPAERARAEADAKAGIQAPARDE